MRWRWDQGRIEYFRYDNIVRVALTLCDLAGVELRSRAGDPLRPLLFERTGLPFAPSQYTVWRNYARVFSCALLATNIDNRLAITDICKMIASTRGVDFTVDDYLSRFVGRFSYPFPAFEEYNVNEDQIFPICAILKLLLARRMSNGEASIKLNEVFSFVIGNNCTGWEDIEHYLRLRKTSRTPYRDELRQVRELIIFCSQLNFLKWHRNSLFLDLDLTDEESVSSILQLATPVHIERETRPSAQLLRLGALPDDKQLVVPIHTREQPTDILFTEGAKVRVTHIRVERSPRLRRMYFELMTLPFICDMCDVNLVERYPWTANILELHHLLPLSSTIGIDNRGTSIEDIEPLCPNCHKSIHVFYATFLTSANRDDFESKEEARRVYSDAKRSIVL